MKQVFVFSLICFFSLLRMTCFAWKSAALNTLSTEREVLNTHFKNFPPIQETDVSPSSFNNGCSGSFRLTGGLPEMNDQAWYQLVISKIDEPDIKGTLLNITKPKHNDPIEFFVPEPGQYLVQVEDDAGNYHRFLIDMGSCQAVEFSIGSSTALPGNTVCLEMKVRNFQRIESFQGELGWDPTYLKFSEIKSFTPNLVDFNLSRSISTAQSDMGRLRWSWFHPELLEGTLNDDEVLFELCFEAYGDIGQETSLTFNTDWFEIISGTNLEEFGYETNEGAVRLSLDSLFVDYTIQNVTCSGANNGEVEVFVDGGVGPYLVRIQQVSPPSIYTDSLWINAPEGSIRFFDLYSGSYAIWIQDSSVVTNVFTGEINISAPPPIGVNLEGILPACNNTASGVVVANVFVNGIRVDQPEEEFIFTWNMFGESTSILNGVPSGFYSVNVTDSIGCTANASVTLADPPALDLDVNIMNASCTGNADGSIEFIANGGTPPYNISSPYFSGVVDGPSTPFIVEGLSERYYDVKLTDFNGCELDGTFLVRNSKKINLNASIVPESCTGSGNGQINIRVSSNIPEPPFSFEWASDTSVDLPAQNTDFTSRLSNLTTGTYYLTVSDQAVPVCTLVDTFTVEPAIQITVDTMGNANCVCNGYAIFSAENLNDSTDVLDLSWQGNGREGNYESLFSLCPGTYVLEAASANENCIETDTLIITEQRINCCDRRRDSLALVTLYNVTNGQQWVNPWILTQPMNSWSGVFLNADGCVVHLDLDGIPDERQSSNTTNGLNGSIPEEIGEMLDLEILNLSQNRELVGGIPASIGELLNLQVIEMLNNGLTEPLPEEIGNLSRLWYFSVNNNFIKGQIPQSFGRLKNLRFLFLNDNKELSGIIPDTLTTLGNLEVVRLDGNKFVGVVPDFSNQPLSVLRIENNDLDELPDLSAITTWGTENGSGFLVYDNQFTFEDILPNMGPGEMVPWIYTPQDSIFTDTTITRAPGESLTIDLGIDEDITTNTYTWFKDGQPYTTRTDNQLVFNNLQSVDAGVYTVEVINPGAPDLTLYGRPVKLNVAEDTVRFVIPDTMIQTGQEFCLPVRVENFLPLRGLQFSINYDSTLLEFTEVRNFALPGEIGNSFGTPEIRGVKGDIIFAWTHPQQQTTSLPDGTTLFELCFRSLGTGSTSVALSGLPTGVEVIDSSINLMPYVLKSGNVVMEEDCRMRDSLALVRFFNELEGADWKTPWNLEDPLDQWMGITLSNEGCVIAISLVGNDLMGELSDELMDFPNLMSVDFRGNSIAGKVPEFTNCPLLRGINLGENFFEGQLPSFSHLTDLDQINFSSNQLTGAVPDFNQLSNLRIIFLQRNNLSGDIPNFSLPNLTLIQLSANELSGNIPQFNCQKLRSINLAGNNLEGGMPDFEYLPDLIYLSVGANNLTGSLPPLNYPKLRLLGLSNNKFSGAFPEINTPSLESLFIEDNDFRSIPDLTYLENWNNSYFSRSVFYLENNQLTFSSILPNMPIINDWPDASIYAPQDSIFTDTTITRVAGESLTIDLGIDENITTSTYTWFKDRQPYTTRIDNQLIFDNLQSSDAGVYTVEVTNPGAPELTLYGRPITLIVPCATFESLLRDTVVICPVVGCHGDPGATLVIPEITPLYVVQDSANYTFQWFKDGQAIPGANKYEYDADELGLTFEPGQYQLRLTNGDCVGFSNIVTVIQEGVSVGINFQTDGLTVDFQPDCELPATATFFWDFGDGNFSREMMPTHTYASVQTYLVRLAVDGIYCNTTATFQLSMDCNDQEYVRGVFIRNCDPSIFKFSNLEELCSEEDTIPLRVEPGPDYGGWCFQNSRNWQWYKDGNPIPGADQQVYNVVEEGTYSFTWTNPNGCLGQSNEIFIPSGRAEYKLNVDICMGDGYQFGDQLIQTPGVYSQNFTTDQGCDSVVDLTLSVLSPSFIILDEQICPGDIFMLNGTEYSDRGTYTQTLTNSVGCDSTITLNLSIDEFSRVNALRFFDRVTCVPDIELSANLPGNTTGLWTSNSPAIIDQPTSPNTQVFELAPGENRFTWTLSSENCPNYSSSDALIIYSEESPVANDDTYFLVADSTTISGNVLDNDQLGGNSGWSVNLLQEPSFGEVQLMEDGRFIYKLAGLPTEVIFSYQVAFEDCSDLFDTAQVRIEIEDIGLDRPTGITPNGDGLNDLFIIPELRDNPEQYPNNELVIFNRWGDIVFKAQPYNNDWGGRDMNTGRPLPAESYYYIIRLDLGNQELRDGVITIIR